MLNKKYITIFIILFIFLLLLLLFFSKFYLSFKVNKEGLLEGQDSRQEKIIDKNLNNSTTTLEHVKNKEQLLNDQIRINNEIYKLALSKLDPNICAKLEIQNKSDLCIKHIALEKISLDICDLIQSNITKQECANELLLKKAQEEKNLIFCNQLDDKYLLKTCVFKVLEQDIALKECQKLDLKNELKTDENLNEVELRYECENMIMYREGLNAKNISTCEAIEWPYYRAKCLAGIKNIGLNSDLDQDGLSFLDEIYEGTDPNNPDTDQDGYLDGAEVEGDYNPLGGGMEERWWLMNEYNKEIFE